MTTRVDGPASSMAPDPDDGDLHPDLPSTADGGPGSGSDWVRAEMQRRMAANRSTRGRHARRAASPRDQDAGSTGPLDTRSGAQPPADPPPPWIPARPSAADLPENYVPRHSVQTPGPAADPNPPISGPIPVVRPADGPAGGVGFTSRTGGDAPRPAAGPVGAPSLSPAGLPIRRRRGSGPGTPLQADGTAAAGPANGSWARPSPTIRPRPARPDAAGPSSAAPFSAAYDSSEPDVTGQDLFTPRTAPGVLPGGPPGPPPTGPRPVVPHEPARRLGAPPGTLGGPEPIPAWGLPLATPARGFLVPGRPGGGAPTTPQRGGRPADAAPAGPVAAPVAGGAAPVADSAHGPATTAHPAVDGAPADGVPGDGAPGDGGPADGVALDEAPADGTGLVADGAADGTPEHTGPNGAGPDRAGPDGVHRNGAAVAGAAPNGTGLNGTAPNGTAPSDAAVPTGAAVDGPAPNGPAPNGTGLNGTGLNGTGLNGTALNGTALNGAAVHDAAVNGAAVDGPRVDRVAVDGTGVDGTGVDGTAPEGPAGVGTGVDGTAPHGATVGGTGATGSGPLARADAARTDTAGTDTAGTGATPAEPVTRARPTARTGRTATAGDVPADPPTAPHPVVVGHRLPPPGRVVAPAGHPVAVPAQRGGESARALTPRPATPRHVPVVGVAPEPGSTRVRVVLSERKGMARTVRTIKEVQEGTPVGALLRSDLIRSQLRVTARFALLTVLVLGTLPAVFALLPVVGQARVLGVGVPWVVLGFLMYPFLVGVAWRYKRVADRVEQNFADNVQSR